MATGTTGKNVLSLIAALGTVGFMAAAQPATAQEIQLKLAHFLPTANGMHKDFMVPWAHDLETCSGGKVKVTLYPGGTQLGNIGRLYDEVSSGVVDIAHGLAGVPAGRLNRLRLMEVPFTIKTANAGARALWDLHDEIKPDFPNLKILGLHMTNAGQLHMVKKRVRTTDDLKGMRIRFPSEAVKDMLSYLGAVPVGLPPGAVYENMEKGVIDGAAFTWDAMDSFKLAEVTQYHLDAKVHASTFWFAMNQKKYDSMPKDVQACVDKLSGAALAAKFGQWWNDWDAPGLKLVKEKKHTIDVLSDAERANWRKLLTPMIDKYIATAQSRGVKDAAALYAKMQARVAVYEK
jgi:TRAP-type C4-dicarboxylate transport system substrate-binding protein